MADCLKKYLPTDMDGSSAKKLRDSQCYQIATSKVKEVKLTTSIHFELTNVQHHNQIYHNQFLKCMAGNKSGNFIGMCKQSKTRDAKMKCAHQIINKFAVN